MLRAGTIQITAARELLNAVTKRGVQNAQFVARAGLSRDMLQEDIGTLPLAAFTGVLEVAAYETGNRTLGLELGRMFRFSALGPIARLIQTARTLGAALDQFTRFFATIQTNTRSALCVEDGMARLVYSVTDPAVRFRDQDAAFTLAVEFSMLANLAGQAWDPAAVEFEHGAGADMAAYKEHFRCPLRFGCFENAIVFPARLLDAPLREADERLHAKLEADLAAIIRHQTAETTLVESVAAWITASLCRTVSTDIEIAAGDFGMSARTFQRTLAVHGMNFLGIRNKVRLQIAKCLLSDTDVPVTEIAFQLGYSETSAFSRGFRTFVGQAPQDFRRRTRGRASS